jgi:hypothetical protein
MTQTTRASILTETQSTLVAAATSAGSRVYIARSDVFATVELPAIALDIDRETETIQIDGQGGSVLPVHGSKQRLATDAVCQGRHRRAR